MADVKKIALIGAGVALLAKMLTSQESWSPPQSIHEFEIEQNNEVTPLCKKFLVNALYKKIPDRFPIALLVTDVKFAHYHIMGHENVRYDIQFKWDPDLSLILWACVESACGHDMNIEEIGDGHFRAVADDVGPFHVNREVFRNFDWGNFTIDEYNHEVIVALNTNADGKRLNYAIAVIDRWRRQGLLPADFAEAFLNGENHPDWSKYLSLAIYHHWWNRNAEPGTINARNFLRKYSDRIMDLNEAKTMKITYGYVIS